MATIESETAALLARLMRRLPPSLWDTDPAAATLHRDLYHACASQMAVWLDNRAIARRMTLLLEAEGLDLDTLLADYGLRRYLHRPDPYARQVGMHLLHMPKATTYAVRRVADLLFDLPHVTLDTGLHQTHVVVADTHPVTTAVTYWGMISQEGRWVSLTIDHGLPVVSTFPPPGMNTAPAGAPLAWFTVHDEHQQPWYVVIEGGTLALTDTPPAWGTGTAVPFRVLDGAQGLWELRVSSLEPVLEAVQVTGLEPYGYWRLQSSDTATLYYLYVSGAVAVLSTIAPPGRDETPGAAALDWLTVWEHDGTPWYLLVEGGTLATTRVLPTGVGTDVVYRVLDEDGTWWELGVESGSTALELRLVTPGGTRYAVLDPGHLFEAVQLVNEDGVPWWLSVREQTPCLSDSLPAGAQDVTPPGGPYRWLRLYDVAGTRWYGFPTTSFGLWTVATTTPGGAGTAAVQTLGDTVGVRWHFGVDPSGAFALSNTPRRTFEGLSTALALMDGQEQTWFWRLGGTFPFFEVSQTLWPDSLAQTPWGAIGWLAATSATGAPRYIFPEIGTGAPVVSTGPPLGAPWGWADPVLLYDQTGQAWALEVDASETLVYTSQLPDDIPMPSPVLSLRDARDALAHVQSAGALVTILIT